MSETSLPPHSMMNGSLRAAGQSNRLWIFGNMLSTAPLNAETLRNILTPALIPASTFSDNQLR